MKTRKAHAFFYKSKDSRANSAGPRDAGQYMQRANSEEGAQGPETAPTSEKEEEPNQPGRGNNTETHRSGDGANKARPEEVGPTK